MKYKPVLLKYSFDIHAIDITYTTCAIVNHYQNKTLYNNVFFRLNFYGIVEDFTHTQNPSYFLYAYKVVSNDNI